MLTVNGINFVSGSKVSVNGIQRFTTFVNSKRLSVAVPAVDLITAGTRSITVTNPGTGPSNARILIIKNPYDYTGATIGSGPDGKVDTNDVNFLTNVIVGNVWCPADRICDINRDGTVNIADAVALINYIKQLTIPFP